MSLHRYLDELVEMTTHNLVGRHSQEHLHVLGNKGVLRPHQGDPASSQTLEDRESSFSFCLSLVRCLLFQGLISSIEVSREVVLTISVPIVDRVAIVTRSPFSVTRTVLALKLDNGSFFFAFIRAYILWLNLVVIPARGKHLFKKKKKKKKKKGRNDELNTYSFSPRCRGCTGRTQMALDQGSRRQESAGPLNCQNPLLSSHT